MKSLIKQFSGFFAFVGILFIMIGAGFGDNENLLPTIICVALGSFFVFIYTRIEKAQEEEKESELN